MANVRMWYMGGLMGQEMPALHLHAGGKSFVMPNKPGQYLDIDERYAVQIMRRHTYPNFVPFTINKQLIDQTRQMAQLQQKVKEQPQVVERQYTRAELIALLNAMPEDAEEVELVADAPEEKPKNSGKKEAK
jgi:hypothetical protein